MSTTALMALPLVIVSAGAQQSASVTTADSIAQAGRAAGRVAAGQRGIGRYAALGVVTGFVAGAAGIPLIAGNNRIYAVATFVPVIATIAAADASRPAPPPAVASRIATEPASYQEGFRAAYAQRLTQRRRRAALIGGLSGVAAGAVAVAAFVVAVVASTY